MKKFGLKKTVIAVALATGALLSIPANSSVNTELNSFYSSMGGLSVATPPAVAEGQSAYYLSLGTVKARTPVRNFTLGSIALPKASGGCGGIDVFGGAFSMINVDQFIALLKNIGSNAIGFAFQLAIDVISPQIAGELKDLRSYIDKFNQFNMNSCSAAKALVGGALEVSGLQQSYCESASLDYTMVPDGAAAKDVCKSDVYLKDLYATAESKPDKASKDWVRTFSGNLIWEGLKKRGFDPVNVPADRDIMQLIMSITGTLIIPSPNDTDPVSGDRLPYQFKIGSLKYSDLVYADQASAVGMSADLLQCDNGDWDRCLTVSTYPGGVDLKTFRTKIKGLVDDIAIKVGPGGGALTQEELNLIGMMDVPIFGLMQAAADVGVGELDAVTKAFTNYATAEVAYSFLNDAASTARAAIMAAPTAGTDAERQAFLKNLENFMKYAADDVGKERKAMGGTFDVMNRIDEYRVRAMNRYAPDMQRRIALARALRTPR